MDFEQGSNSSQKGEHGAVLGELRETHSKHVGKNKGGLRAPLSIPQIHICVDSGLIGNMIKYFRQTWGGFEDCAEKTEVINININISINININIPV